MPSPIKLPNYIREAINNYIPPLEGGDWAPLERRCEMAELVCQIKPKVVVEIGTFGGASAIPMAFALRHINKGGKIYCVDPWRLDYAKEGEWEENQKWYENNVNLHDVHRKCMEAIWSHRIDEWLVVIRAASQYCAELFPQIDLLLVDGNHSEIASLRDAELYVPRVRKGGFVLIDDLDWSVPVEGTPINSTKKAVEFTKSSCDSVRQSGNMGIYRKR